jgi:4-hydroxy-3-polyprenylbenzoate decarboxylase
VDDDIDPRDADSVNWAMSYRIQPHRDIEIRDIAASTGLDFSLVPPEARAETTAVRASAILIDATRKWNYPPTSLPEKQFMDKALALWRELELPPLKLKTPWYGYNLGSWSAEDIADAERALRGEHYKTGALREQQRVRLQDSEKK